MAVVHTTISGVKPQMKKKKKKAKEQSNVFSKRQMWQPMAVDHWLLHNEALAAGCYMAKQIVDSRPAASWQISCLSSFVCVCVRV